MKIVLFAPDFSSRLLLPDSGAAGVEAALIAAGCTVQMHLMRLDLVQDALASPAQALLLWPEGGVCSGAGAPAGLDLWLDALARLRPGLPGMCIAPFACGTRKARRSPPDWRAAVSCC